MKPAQSFGPEYLTYVLWAITPEGRPENLGEVVLKDKNDKDSDLHVSSNLQSFGMIVTAEPYFGVTRPSDLVVMENQIGPNLKADIRPIDARFAAVDKTEYGVNVQRADLPASSAEKDVPLELLEARNALVIAKAADAKQYAESSWTKAESALTDAENAYRRDKGSSEVGTAARLAVQTAEDARLMAIRKKQEEKVAQERAEAQQRQQETQQRADEARMRADQESQRAQQAQLDAQRQEEQRKQAELDKQSADRARQDAELAAQRAADERRQAEDAKQQALAQQQQLAQQAQQAQLQAQQADQARQEAERQVQETRQRLQTQLNSVLQTRESARGLIVNMNDVLFDTGKATLKPGARVKLAKVAGIVMAYPDLKLQVEGFTDSTGSEDFNQQLSERRANTVRDFLSSQGVPAATITSQGFGESEPIATNDSAAGRQLNRRVELVVSGQAIGQATTAHAPATETPSTDAQQQPGVVASPTAQPTTPR
jgi:outer membrane protein OmpA-like peptidoglycan-associated protein